MPRLLAPWFLMAPFAALHIAADRSSRAAKAEPPWRVTTYRIETSEKFEALCLVNLLADDPFYVEYYPAEHAWWRDRVPPETLSAARAIKRVLKDEAGGIVSASLVLYLSVRESTTVSGTLDDHDDIDSLGERFRRTPYYDPESWARFASIAPELLTVLLGLQRAGFPEYWASTLRPALEERARCFVPELERRDIVPLQESMLGSALEERSITVYFVHFCRPHGIKITGNRFLSEADVAPGTVLRSAIHEMMHPPFDRNDAALRQAV